MNAKELIEKFAEHCDACGCSRCRYRDCGFIGVCLKTYLEQVRSGKMSPEDGFEEVRDESK